MIAQTSYARAFNAAFAGQLGDSDLSRRIVGSLNAAGAAVSAGIGVIESTTADEFTLPSDAGTDNNLAGVVLNTFARNPGDQSVQLAGTTAIVNGGMANLLTRGAVWVSKETGAIAMGDLVYLRYTAAGGAVAGQFSNTSDGGKNVVLKGARWLAAAASGDAVALLEIDVMACRSAAT